MAIGSQEKKKQFSIPECLYFMNLKKLRTLLGQLQDDKKKQKNLIKDINACTVPPNYFVYNRQNIQRKQNQKINQFSEMNNQTNLFLMMESNILHKDKEQQFVFKQEKIQTILINEINKLKQTCIYCKITENVAERIYQFQISSQNLNIQQSQFENFRFQLCQKQDKICNFDFILQTYTCILFYETLFINPGNQKNFNVKQILKLKLVIQPLQAEKKYRIIYRIEKQNLKKTISQQEFSNNQYLLESKDINNKNHRRIIISKKAYLLKPNKQDNFEKGAFGLVKRGESLELAMTQSENFQNFKTIEAYFKKSEVAIKRFHQDSATIAKKGYRISQRRQGIILNLINQIKRKEKINELRRECGLSFQSKLIGIQNIVNMVQSFQLLENDKRYIYVISQYYTKSLTEISRNRPIKAGKQQQNSKIKSKPIKTGKQQQNSKIQRRFEQYFCSKKEQFSDQIFKIIQKLITSLYCLHYQIGAKYPSEIRQYYKIQREIKDSQSKRQLKEENIPLGIYHRDIKPPNILINKIKSKQMIKIPDQPFSDLRKQKDVEDQKQKLLYQQMWKQVQVFLIDMGMCKIGNVNEIKNSTLCGSHYYMSPQMRQSQPYDAKVDIWSAGIILFELISRDQIKFYRHFESYYMSQVVENIQTAIKKLQSSTSQQLLNKKWFTLLRMMLVKDPNKRASSKQVLQFLKINQLELKNIQIDKELSQKKDYTHLFSTTETELIEYKKEETEAKKNRINNQSGSYHEYFIGNLLQYELISKRYQIILAIQYYFRLIQNLDESYENSIISYRYTENQKSKIYIEISKGQNNIKSITNRRKNVEIIKPAQNQKIHIIIFKDSLLRGYKQQQYFFGFQIEPDKHICKKALFKEYKRVQIDDKGIQKLASKDKKNTKIYNTQKIQSQFLDEIANKLQSKNNVEILDDKQQIYIGNYLIVREEKELHNTKIYFCCKSFQKHLSKFKKQKSSSLKSIFQKINNILTHQYCRISPQTYVNIQKGFIKQVKSDSVISNSLKSIPQNIITQIFTNFRYNIEYFIASLCKKAGLQKIAHCWVSLISENRQIFTKILGIDQKILQKFNSNNQQRQKQRARLSRPIQTLQYLHNNIAIIQYLDNNTTIISHEIDNSKKLLSEFNRDIKIFVFKDYLLKLLQ